MKTGHKLAVLGALYLAQGVPYGFFTQALPVVLRQQGVSLEAIGLASLLALPWAAKALWAPVIERVGSLRSWILGLQALGVLLCLVLAANDPAGGTLGLVVAVLCCNLVASTQDIATDGLAVRLLGPHERGFGNGLQVGGYRVGMILGGSALLVVYDRVGWSTALGLMAVVLALATLPLWASPGVGAARAEAVEGSGHPWDWVHLPGALGWMAVLVAYKAGDYLGQGMLRPWMVDQGLSTSEIGVLLGALGFSAGLLGALVGGLGVPRLGVVSALRWFGLAQSSGVAAYAAVVALGETGGWLWAAVGYEHFVGGLATVALFTAMMEASRQEQAATDYTLQASVVVVASGVASGLSGFGAAAWGYGGLYGVAAVASLLGPLLASWPGCVRRVEGG